MTSQHGQNCCGSTSRTPLSQCCDVTLSSIGGQTQKTGVSLLSKLIAFTFLGNLCLFFFPRRPPVRKGSYSFKLGTGVENVTSNCMGRAVRQFDKEVSFRLETGVGYVTPNCMRRAVRQFDKEVSFSLFSSRAFVISGSSKFMGIVEAKQMNH